MPRDMAHLLGLGRLGLGVLLAVVILTSAERAPRAGETKDDRPEGVAIPTIGTCVLPPEVRVDALLPNPVLPSKTRAAKDNQVPPPASECTDPTVSWRFLDTPQMTQC